MTDPTAGDPAGMGTLEEAVSACRRAIEEAPLVARLHHRLGGALSSLERWEEAAAAFRRAAELEPDDPAPHRRLGEVLSRLGRWEEAAAAFQRALPRDRAATGWDPAPGPPADLGDLYLDLMRQCLTFMLWDAKDGSLLEMRGGPVYALAIGVKRLLRLVRPLDPALRAGGHDWPALAHTMVGTKRLDNVRDCIEDVLRNRVPGDLIEAGVWRGGVTIFMRAVLRAHGVRDRTVWVADSFAGLPKPDSARYPEDGCYDLSGFKSLAVPVDEVRANFARYGLLDGQVAFLEGWFRDTLPAAPIERLAVMRLDADLYESTMDALTNLYPRLSPGGYVIVDDYWNSPPCHRAVNDYRRQHGIEEPIVIVDWSGITWQKKA